MDAIKVSDTSMRTAQLMTPNDANFLGKVFGGSILSLIDLCAAATSSKFAGTMCVTASFDRVDFLQPVEIGELVELDALITYVGRTSMEVTINVHATHLINKQSRHVNTARVTMVAIRDGKSCEVPRLICETRADKLRFLEGKLRRELRVERQHQFSDLHQKLSQAEEGILDKLIEPGQTVLDHFA